jgi:hypothetical protein
VRTTEPTRARPLATIRRLVRHVGPCLALLGLAVAPSGCAPAPISGGGYELVFRDEFDDTSLSPLWAPSPVGGSLPPEVGWGVMTIRTTADNGYQWGVVASTGPRVATEPNYPFLASWQEGYFEARVRYSNEAWAWPAFWLFGGAKVEAWPGEDCRYLNAEWDIMENGVQNDDGNHPANAWSFTALHRNTTDGTDDGYCGQPDVQQSYGQHHPGEDLSDWHVWGGLWIDDLLCTYLDGEVIGCMAGYDSTSQAMHIVFSILYLKECAGCGERPPELWLQVDWVRVWQPA